MNELKEILSNEAIEQLKRYASGDEEFYGTALYDYLYGYYTGSGEMPYGTAKARTGDPDVWILEQLHKDGII